MKNLLIKDLRLSASALTYGFLAASLMTMLPGYPILMGAFFICLGIFHSFQDGREIYHGNQSKTKYAGGYSENLFVLCKECVFH